MISLFSKLFDAVFLLTGDQGFLNSYYSEFANAHVFDPNLHPEALKSRPLPEMERLSTLYNADVGLYMLANKVSMYKMKGFFFSLSLFFNFNWIGNSYSY